jgi:transposase
MSLTDFQRKQLQKALENSSLSERNKTRVQIMLLFDSGKSQKQICTMLQCSASMARLWVHVVREGQAHRWQDFCQDGRPVQVTKDYCDRLKDLITHHTPKDFGFAFSKWTAKALQKQLEKELNITISDRHINRLRREITRMTNLQEKELKPISAPSKLMIRDLAPSDSVV